jgi:hypothetical protein
MQRMIDWHYIEANSKTKRRRLNSDKHPYCSRLVARRASQRQRVIISISSRSVWRAMRRGRCRRTRRRHPGPPPPAPGSHHKRPGHQPLWPMDPPRRRHVQCRRGEANERDAWLAGCWQLRARSSRHARGAACVSAWVVFGNNAGPPCQAAWIRFRIAPFSACWLAQSSTREG